MKKKQIRNSLLLVLTALVWGIAFVAQSTGGDAIGPYSFNSIRSIIGSLVLIPVIFLLDRINPSGKRPKTNEEKRTLFLGGFCCGTVLFLASTVQQLGIYYGTSAGKAGFLTACYILLVPVFGLFLKKKCGINIWIGIVIAIAGLYLLCMTDSISFQTSDLMVLLCAVLFALHILVVDHFSPLVDGVRMSCIQFLVCGILSGIPALIFESPDLAGIFAAKIPVLYAGVMSCGVAYTLQIVGQKNMNPTVASLILSLESCISVIAGWLILGQNLSSREIFGCVLMFGAIILAQLPQKGTAF